MELLKNLKEKFSSKKVQLDTKIFTHEEIRLFNEIRNFKISKNILKYYQTNVKGNLSETKEVATKKLIRNIMLAKKGRIDENKPHVRIFYYGNLSILVNFKSKKIIWLNNSKRINTHDFCINKKKKEDLHRVLNIHN